VHGATLAFGAAGRSSLRDRALARPAEAAAVKVRPPPLAVADKSTLAVAAGGGMYRSVWRATQAVSAQTQAGKNVIVAEFAEMLA